MIEFQTSVAKVSVDFKDKINILLGDSGEGKSLLLKLLAVYSENTIYLLIQLTGTHQKRLYGIGLTEIR